MSKKKKSTYPAAVRIIALALTALVASGALVYLVLFIISLFGNGSTSGADLHIH